LHKVIDALQATVKGMHDGYDTKAKMNSEKMKKKFDKLSEVIAKLGKQKYQLFMQNKNLTAENNLLIDKISALEIKMKKQADEVQNKGAEAWLRHTAADLKSFLQESGLEHYASPGFSPLIAGIVTNGVVIVPLAMTSLFMLRYAKQLSMVRILMALNLFDLGFIVAVIFSSALLLGDPLEGLRHISEVNFVFLQLVLASVFWVSICMIIGIIGVNRKNRAWRYALSLLLIRVAVAVDYARRVWVPVIERNDVPIAVPGWCYLLYFCAAIAAVKLTSLANSYSVPVQRPAPTREEDAEVLVSLVTQHDD